MRSDSVADSSRLKEPLATQIGQAKTSESDGSSRLNAVTAIINHYRKHILIAIAIVAIVGFHVYTVFSLLNAVHPAILLVAILALGYIASIYTFGVKPLLIRYRSELKSLSQSVKRTLAYEIYGLPLLISIVFFTVLAGFVTWLWIDSSGNRIRVRSLFGLLTFVLLGVLFSANPSRIKWRPVIGGIVLQFLVGVLVLRWPTGHEAFKWASEQVVTFLDYALQGATFTYGFVASPPNICGFGSVFIYTSLQIIIYFGAVVSVLYYLGIIELVLVGVARIMHITLGTTAAESLNAAACIFLGQTEAAILIEPALDSMTNSEIHAVMTAGFACIAGSLFSAYISFGACPTYLLSATVMSAAVSLSVSKTLYPEIQKSRQKSMSSFKFKERTETNLLECISNGAVHSSQFVWAIGANLVVYIALLAFLNTAVGWFGDGVGIHDLSFNKLLGYVFFPLAYMMGASDASDPHVARDETMKVAELMGMKTILNEFIAYQRLHEMMTDGTLKGARAQMIATYALCGFSNISMIGSQIGILSSMCPHRKSTFAKLAVRALVAGSFSCFMTACVAGILVDKPTSCKGTFGAGCLDLDDLQTFYQGRINTTLMAL